MGTELLTRFAGGLCDLIQSSCLGKYDKLNLQVNRHLFGCSSSHGGLCERTEKETEGLRIRFLHMLPWHLRDNILKPKWLLCYSGVGKFFSAKVMSSLVWAARTKYHRLVARKQQRFICHSLEGRKSESRVPGW